MGFSSSKADNSLFFKNDQGVSVFLLIYVDDILIIGSNRAEIDKVVLLLGQAFSLKDLGEIHHFLGIEVVETEQGLHLSQHKYIQELLHIAHMSNAKGTPTPMITGYQLSKFIENPTINGRDYISIVGVLQYATITRPEISCSVNKVSQFMANPFYAHWKAVKKILRYLSGTSKLWSSYHKVIILEPHIDFSDSDWADDPDDRRSITGYGIYLGNNLVSWSSKMESSVSRSSTEAEYWSLAHTTTKVTWLTSLLGESGISLSRVLVIWVDNISTCCLGFQSHLACQI